MDQEEDSKQVIALCMIVKNEASVIKRALNSVYRIVDKVYICDTGSTDGTQDIIKEFLSDKNIPCEIQDRKWVDFATNRNQCFALAKGNCDYIMTLDADEIFTPYIDKFPDYKKAVYTLPKFTQPRVDVATVFGAFVYYRIQFFKESCGWEWFYPCHEICMSKEPTTMQKLSNVCIIPTQEGDRAKDPKRFMRDALLFENFLIDNPKDSRAIYYLAQSYGDAGQPDKALEAIERIFDSTTWNEEEWSSRFRKARWSQMCHPESLDFINYYLEAYNTRPSRVEPLFYLLLYYASKKMWNVARLLGEEALKISYPDDILFVEKNIYDWRLKSELASVHYNLKNYEKALELSTELLRTPSLPTVEATRLESNIKKYKDWRKEEDSK